MVHFIFNTGLPTKVSPFARKYAKFLDGTLAEFEAAEKEKFAAYAQRLASEELEEGEADLHYCELLLGSSAAPILGANPQASRGLPTS